MFPDLLIAEKANGNGTKHSVQARAKAAPWEELPGFMAMGNSMMVALAQVADDLPAWSIYPLQRDLLLRKFYRESEGALASAIFTMQSKLRSLPYKVKAPGPRTQKHFSDLLGYSDFGKGFHYTIGKLGLDLYTQDNGWFLELIGAGPASSPMRGPVLQIAHLDAAQCWRTFDPDYPVIYTNPYTGQNHWLHKSRVIFGSSFTQSDELARGIGYCGVSRALRYAQIARDIAIYKHEKISGRFKRAIGWGQGFTTKSFKDAIGQHEEEQDTIGYTRYQDIPFVFSPRDHASLDLLDLASLPDGFDSMDEMTQWIYLLAFSFGVDPREFWPATTAGATKADASIQHMKSQNKGFAEDIKAIEHAVNFGVFPEGTTLEFDAKDDEEDLRVAQLQTVRINNVKTMQDAGDITVDEGRAILISQGVINVLTLKPTTAPVEGRDLAPIDLSEVVDIPPLPAPEPAPTPTETIPAPGTRRTPSATRAA